MARNNAPKIELTAYDDLFQTDESRAEAKLSKIRDIPISQTDEFPDHPFKVLMDEDIPQNGRRRKGSHTVTAFRFIQTPERYPKGGQTVRGYRSP